MISSPARREAVHAVVLANAALRHGIANHDEHQQTRLVFLMRDALTAVISYLDAVEDSRTTKLMSADEIDAMLLLAYPEAVQRIKGYQPTPQECAETEAGHNFFDHCDRCGVGASDWYNGRVQK